jgi:2-polyprenyl-3-methyl-5-hydroxy-6-metoxy-1,4-benzoquinol methylase
MTNPSEPEPHRTCPFWVGYLLASPLRKLIHNPHRILRPFIEDSMTVLDLGAAMGFFSLPLAQMVGPGGRVVCVDLQEKMLVSLLKRARKSALADRIETRLSSVDSFGLNDLKEKLDFALAFAVVHEVPGQDRLFLKIQTSLKPGAKLLVAEPKGHVPKNAFARTVQIAQHAGLAVADHLQVSGCHAVLFVKNG